MPHLGWLDTNSLEQHRVPQGQLHQLTNLSQLLAHTTNVIVANL